MNDKEYFELNSDVNNLKKLQEQLETLHRQKIDKMKQVEADESLSKEEFQGKIHEFGFMYKQAVNSIREEFPKKAAMIEEKICAEFNHAYLKEVDIDQKIIELESKMSSYTIHDQTQAILGLLREIRKNNLAKEISEGDYTDLLNLYRIALRTNNRTDLAYIESRIERLTSREGKDSIENEAKNTLLELVRNSIAKRVDPKVLDLKNRFDTILKEHNQIMEAINGDVEKKESNLKQTNLIVLN